MSKFQKSFVEPEPAMKALILYSDFASAAKANAALLRSTENVNFNARWDVKPWRLDMLRFPSTAEEALADAIDAHLILFAGRTAEPLPYWLLNWLEYWANHRRVDAVSLAAIDSKRIDTFATPAAIELANFAKRHGLSFITDKGEVVENKTMSSLQAAITGVSTHLPSQQEFNR